MSRPDQTAIERAKFCARDLVAHLRADPHDERATDWTLVWDLISAVEQFENYPAPDVLGTLALVRQYGAAKWNEGQCAGLGVDGARERFRDESRALLGSIETELESLGD